MARGGAQPAPDPSLDVDKLARKYRGQGQNDEQVYNTLRALGYSRADAKRAVAGMGATSTPRPSTKGTPAPPAGKTPPAASGGSSSPPAATGMSMPKFSAPDVSSVTLTPPRKLNSGDLGGFLAGLVLYVLALNYLTHGTDGVKGWFGAKFLNQPADLPDDAKPQTRKRSGQGSGLTSTRTRQPARV